MRTRSALALLTASSCALYWGCAGDETDDDDDVTTTTGGATQTGTGTGGGSTTGTGSATATGTGGMGGGGGAGDTCAHDVCVAGDALAPDCSPCATAVCDLEDWCCTVEWLEDCVALVGTLCPSVTCGGTGGSGGGTGGAAAAGGMGGSTGSGGGGPCSHDVCDSGPPLVSGCSPCATAVCLADSWCCSVDWDVYCIAQVDTECSGITCGGTGGAGGGGGYGGFGGAGGAGGFGGAGGAGGGVVVVGPGDLVITEIMNNPLIVSDFDGEWFEIYNATGAAIDLQGFVIRHQFVPLDPDATHTIASSVVVNAGGYAVFGINADTSTNGNVSIDYEYPGSINLSNARDYLAIETDDGTVIDETRWNEDVFDPNGTSRNLDPDHLSAAENDDDTNFCEATSYITGSSDQGTPGAANDDCP